MKILICFVLILGYINTSFAISYAAPVTVSVSSDSTLVMPPNGFRQYLIILNNGLYPIIAKFGSVQTGSEGILIPSGGNYEPIEAPTNGVWLKTLTGSSDTTLIQGQ